MRVRAGTVGTDAMLPGGVPEEPEPEPEPLRPGSRSNSLPPLPGDTLAPLQLQQQQQQQQPKRHGGDGLLIDTSSDPDPREVWVGRIAPCDANDDTLRVALGSFGAIESITICAPDEGQETTWALVTFSMPREARAACGARELPERAWQIRPYTGSRLNSEAARRVAAEDKRAHSSWSGSEHSRTQRYLHTIREAKSIDILAHEVEQAIEVYFGWVERDDALGKSSRLLKKKERIYQEGLAQIVDAMAPTGVRIGGYLKSLRAQPEQIARQIAQEVSKGLGGDSSADEEGKEIEDEADTVDLDARKLLDVLRPVVQACLWYAALVADEGGDHYNIVKKQRLICVGEKDHELFAPLSGDGNSQMETETVVVKSLRNAMGELAGSATAGLGLTGQVVEKGSVRCVVVALQANADFSYARRFSTKLKGQAPVYWYVDPGSVPDSLLRDMRACGWEIVDPCVKMMNFALKTRSFVFKVLNFAGIWGRITLCITSSLRR